MKSEIAEAPLAKHIFASCRKLIFDATIFVLMPVNEAAKQVSQWANYHQLTQRGI